MLIACPNLTIDRVLELDEMRPGEVLRCTSSVMAPGGKGVNVARVARALRSRAAVVGFVPGHTGQAVAGLLADEGIDLCQVPIGGEVRSTAAIVENSGRVTVINEPGPTISSSDWADYELAVQRHLQGHQTLICTGSVPPGSPADAYARLVAMGRRAGCWTLVDAGGSLLRAALAERPSLVAPNLSEAATALGLQCPDEAAASDRRTRTWAVELGKELVSRGAGAAVLTAGATGLALVDEHGGRWLPAPVVQARSPLGAGDSFMGGLVVALEEGRGVDEAVRFGAAAAASSVEHLIAGQIEVARVQELLGTITWSDPG